MIRKINGTFTSRKLEEQFQAQQLNGIIYMSKILQWLLVFSYFANGLVQIIRADYITPVLMLILAFFSYFQLRYFAKKPSFNVLRCMNITNICFASYRIFQVRQALEVSKLDPSDEFVRGASFFGLHLSLLVNTDLTSNIIVVAIVFGIHYGVLTYNLGHFNYYAFGLLGCIGFFLSRLYISYQIRRKVFLLQKEQCEWENIIKALIDYPYLIITYDYNELKFSLKHANQSAISQLKIQDSETLRSVLREMFHFTKNKKSHRDFETYIFSQINRMESKDVCNEEYNISYNKQKYAAQIFVVSAEPITLLITFKNLKKTIFLNTLQQTMINQQIACCNFANNQLKFCKIIEASVKTKNTQLSHISLRKNIFYVANLLAIFKSNFDIKISSFVIEREISKISWLFPRINFSQLRIRQICNSDLRIFRQMIYNIFSIFKDCSQISIEVEGKLNGYFIKVISYAVSEKKYTLLKKTYDDEMIITHLNMKCSHAQQNLSIFSKLLQIVSPHQRINLFFDKTQCNTYKIYQNPSPCNFNFTKILHQQINDLIKLLMCLIQINDHFFQFSQMLFLKLYSYNLLFRKQKQLQISIHTLKHTIEPSIKLFKGY